MDDILNSPSYWYWFTAGVLLVALEALIPGFVLVWLGVSALITGVVALVFTDMGLVFELLIFAGLSVATVLTGRRWFTRLNENSSMPLLNRRGEQYVGQRYTLHEPIRDGRGRVKVGDSLWNVRGPDLPAGAHVQVTSVDGATFIVERVD